MFVVFDPAIQVYHVHEYATVRPHRRELAARDHVLDRLFGAPEIRGCLLNGQESRHTIRVPEATFELNGHLVSQGLRERVQEPLEIEPVLHPSPQNPPQWKDFPISSSRRPPSPK